MRSFQASGGSNVCPPTKLLKPSAQWGCEHKEVTSGWIAGIYFSCYLPSHKFPLESWKLKIENAIGTHWVSSPAHWETPPTHYISSSLALAVRRVDLHKKKAEKSFSRSWSRNSQSFILILNVHLTFTTKYVFYIF